MEKFKLHVEREIAVSHKLTKHLGKCSREHGHNLLVEVDIETGELLKGGSSDGMVVDFGDIKQIIDSIDHTNLNTTLAKIGIEFELQPTAERVAKLLAEMIAKHMDEKARKSEIDFNLDYLAVRVHEAKGQWAEFRINN